MASSWKLEIVVDHWLLRDESRLCRVSNTDVCLEGWSIHRVAGDHEYRPRPNPSTPELTSLRLFKFARAYKHLCWKTTTTCWLCTAGATKGGAWPRHGADFITGCESSIQTAGLFALLRITDNSPTGPDTIRETEGFSRWVIMGVFNTSQGELLESVAFLVEPTPIKGT